MSGQSAAGSGTAQSRGSSGHGGGWSQAGNQSNMEKEIQEYFTFRSFLMSGDLKILKKELVHVLYKMYIRIIRNQIQWLAQRSLDKQKAQDNIE